MDTPTIEQFKKIQQRQLKGAIPVLALAVVAFLMKNQTGTLHDALFLVTFLAIMAYALMTMISWRCPVCHKPLGKNFTSEHCPNPKCQANFRTPTAG